MKIAPMIRAIEPSRSNGLKPPGKMSFANALKSGRSTRQALPAKAKHVSGQRVEVVREDLPPSRSSGSLNLNSQNRSSPFDAHDALGGRGVVTLRSADDDLKRGAQEQHAYEFQAFGLFAPRHEVGDAAPVQPSVCVGLEDAGDVGLQPAFLTREGRGSAHPGDAAAIGTTPSSDGDASAHSRRSPLNAGEAAGQSQGLARTTLRRIGASPVRLAVGSARQVVRTPQRAPRGANLVLVETPDGRLSIVAAVANLDSADIPSVRALLTDAVIAAGGEPGDIQINGEFASVLAVKGASNGYRRS